MRFTLLNLAGVQQTRLTKLLYHDQSMPNTPLGGIGSFATLHGSRNNMDQITKLTANLHLNSGASKDLVKEIQSKLGNSLPKEYVDFMTQSNGAEGNVGNSYLVLWPLEEIGPLNEAYEVDEYAPGLLLFGSDGGGEA